MMTVQLPFADGSNAAGADQANPRTLIPKLLFSCPKQLLKHFLFALSMKLEGGVMPVAC
jgi:hypothetical protein